MTPTLLAYQIDPKKLGKMQIVCLRLGIRVQAVDPADFGQTIGALAGVLLWCGARAGVRPREPDAPAAPLPGEMLVMANFRPGLLEGMLQGWRAAHIPPVALKAMLTDTNAAWTAPALYAEIAKEHAAMHSGGRAHKA